MRITQKNKNLPRVNILVKKLSLILIAFLFLSVSTWSQINFKSLTKSIPNYSNFIFQCVQIGDVTNDGLNDILVGSTTDTGSSTGANIHLFVQKKDGSMSEPIKMKYSKSNIQLYEIEITDMNNDKLNDIVLTFGYTVGIYYQLPTGGFSPIRIITESIVGWDGTGIGDLNNDGLKDIVGYDSIGKCKIYYQNQSGDFILTTFQFKIENCQKIQVADLNGDNLIDVAKIATCTIEIHYQIKGTGISKDSVFIIDACKNLSFFTNMAIDDVNNDGRNDIVANYGGNSGYFNIYNQDTNGRIDTTNVETVATYDNATPVCIADLNCDGDNEIIYGHNGWGNVSVFDKHAHQKYNNYTLYPSVYYYRMFSMAVGDLNNDNKKDIVAVGDYAKVNILYNNSKPYTFDSYENRVANLIIKRDTTDTIVNTYYTTTIQSNLYYDNINYYKNEVVKVYNNEHYSADSLLIRHGMLCSTSYTDTVITAFSYFKSNFIIQDTIKTVVNPYFIEPTDKNIKYKIYPNPVKDHIIIESNDIKPITQIQLYGLTGIIYSKPNLWLYIDEIDFKQIPKGIYILKVKTESDEIIRKIIKD